jgi:hypothetical protein
MAWPSFPAHFGGVFGDGFLLLQENTKPFVAESYPAWSAEQFLRSIRLKDSSCVCSLEAVVCPKELDAIWMSLSAQADVL